MPPVARQSSDVCDGACTAPPAPAQTGSPNVNVNGQPCMRVGDPFVPHARPLEPPHGRVVSSGSSTVHVNGMQIARIGDPLSCGANIATGSSNVNAGG